MLSWVAALMNLDRELCSVEVSETMKHSTDGHVRRSARRVELLKSRSDQRLCNVSDATVMYEGLPEP